MSVFIVSNACMQRVVTAVKQENHSCEDATSRATSVGDT